MTSKKSVCLVLGCVLFLLILLTSQSLASTNSALIIADTLAGFPSCVHYEIKGSCFWLSSTGSPVTTPYVQHYLPDVVVSTFNKPDDNPWLEIHETLDQAGKITQSEIVSLLTGMIVNGGQHSFQNVFEQHVFFKEVDVIGNPALPLLPATLVLLPSAAVPLVPYFQSMLDSALWRGFPPQAVPEQLAAYGEDIIHYIGSGATVWGGAYPFEGKVETANDMRAAAVITQRAGNLLTAGNQWGHLVTSLPTSCGVECQAAVIKEDDPQTQFQLIYPQHETSCIVFGKSATYGENVAIPANGAYVWVLWRQYHGCIPCPGCAFISKIVI